jgi:hypothetical protein
MEKRMAKRADGKGCVILLLYLGLCGCAPLLVGAAVGTEMGASKKSLAEVTALNNERLSMLPYGFSKKGILSIMGTTPFYAYRSEIAKGKTITKQVTIPNPYRSENLTGNGRTFEVVYYATDDKNKDNLISDDDLTPLVFEDGKLIGWGWVFWQGKAQKYEIKLR